MCVFGHSVSLEGWAGSHFHSNDQIPAPDASLWVSVRQGGRGGGRQRGVSLVAESSAGVARMGRRQNSGFLLEEIVCGQRVTEGRANGSVNGKCNLSAWASRSWGFLSFGPFQDPQGSSSTQKKIPYWFRLCEDLWLMGLKLEGHWHLRAVENKGRSVRFFKNSKKTVSQNTFAPLSLRKLNLSIQSVWK